MVDSNVSISVEKHMGNLCANVGVCYFLLGCLSGLV